MTNIAPKCLKCSHIFGSCLGRMRRLFLPANIENAEMLHCQTTKLCTIMLFAITGVAHFIFCHSRHISIKAFLLSLIWNSGLVYNLKFKTFWKRHACNFLSEHGPRRRISTFPIKKHNVSPCVISIGSSTRTLTPLCYRTWTFFARHLILFCLLRNIRRRTIFGAHRGAEIARSPTPSERLGRT